MREAFDRFEVRTERNCSWPVSDSLKKMKLSEIQHGPSRILEMQVAELSR